MDIMVVIRAYTRWLVPLALIVTVIGAITRWTHQEEKIEVKAAAKVDFKVPKDRIKKVVLDNGMTILLFQDKSTPRVLVQIAYDIGSAIEESGERGLAHLIEHMIFKGTKKLSEGDIDAIARKFGAGLNAFTSYDVTGYFFESDKANWKHFVDILADCMQNARFDDQHLASELKTVVQEINMYRDSYIRRMFDKAFELLFPASHPYHYPVIGYKEELARMSGERLKKFYDKYYSPERATLFIVGDIDLDDAAECASGIFSKIPLSKNEPLQRKFPELVAEMDSHVLRLYEDIQKEWLGLFWRIPGIKSGDDTISFVVEDIIGQGEGSRLYKRLVDVEEVADAVVCSVDELMEEGILGIFVAPKEGKRDRCCQLVVEELEKIAQGGVTSDEVARTVAGGMTKFFGSMENPQDLVAEWMDRFFVTRDEYEVFTKPERYYQVTPESVQKFVATYLDPFLMKQVELLPLPENKRALWQAAKDQSKRIETEILKAHQRTTSVEKPKFVNILPEPAGFRFDFPTPTDCFTLSNGLRVVLHQDKSLPLVTASCRFRDSERFAKSEKGLLVGMMMDMLIEGSSKSSKQENVEGFKSLGVEYDFDSTGASISCLDANFGSAFEHFFYVLREPAFDKDSLRKLKSIAINGYQRSKDVPGKVVARELAVQIYRGTDCAWSYDDAAKLVEKASLGDLSQLHENEIAPSKMILSIAGSFDVEELKKLMETSVSDWAGSQHDELPALKRKFVAGSKIDIPMLRDQTILAFGQPSNVTVYDDDRIPLALVSFIGFHSLGSRLYNVREQSGLFYGAAGAFAAQSGKEPGYDYLMAILSPDKLGESEKKLRGVVDEMAQGGVSADELAQAKQIYLKALVNLSSSRASVAEILSVLESRGLGFDHYQKAWDRVQSITVSDINDICKKYCHTDNMVRVRVGRV